jgi:hypothetical protein
LIGISNFKFFLSNSSRKKRHKQYKRFVANTIKSISNPIYIKIEKSCLRYHVAHCLKIRTSFPSFPVVCRFSEFVGIKPAEFMNRLISTHIDNLCLLDFVHKFLEKAPAPHPYELPAARRRRSPGAKTGQIRTSRVILKKAAQRLALQIDLQTPKGLWAAEKLHHKKLLLNTHNSGEKRLAPPPFFPHRQRDKEWFACSLSSFCKPLKEPRVAFHTDALNSRLYGVNGPLESIFASLASGHKGPQEIIVKNHHSRACNASFLVQNLSLFVIAFLKKNKGSKNKAQALKNTAQKALDAIFLPPV